METIKEPIKDNRVLIIVPHPDDEILATGGFIYKGIKNKASIKVVIVTCGENFGYAVGKNFFKFWPPQKKALEFGSLRQKESLKILKKLGVENKDIIFLGFPDKALKFLWCENWFQQKPYYSPILKTNYSPYQNICQNKVVFSGQNLYFLLKKIIFDFCPDILITSSFYDHHPDHQMLFNFVQKIITENDLPVKNLNFYSFLIHWRRFTYPLPYGFHPDKEINPPLILRKKNIVWQKFYLDSETFSVKKKAIFSYQTQILAVKELLTSFIRKNELFHNNTI